MRNTQLESIHCVPLTSVRREQKLHGGESVRKETVVVEERHVGGCDDPASEPAAVQRIDRGYCCSNGRTLAVNISVGRCFVNKHVQHSAMFITFLNYVISNLYVPIRHRLPAKPKTIKKRKWNNK